MSSYKVEDFLAHHGIPGQKKGVRRFQNPDGTLTEEGIRRYRSENYQKSKKNSSKDSGEPERRVHKDYKEKAITLDDDELSKRVNRMNKEIQYKNYQKQLYPDKREQRQERIRKIFVDSAFTAAASVMQSVYTDLGKRALGKVGILRNSGGNQPKKDQSSKS